MKKLKKTIDLLDFLISTNDKSSPLKADSYEHLLQEWSTLVYAYNILKKYHAKTR